MHIAPLPFALHPLGEPAELVVDENTVRIAAGRRADWFVDPASGVARMNAPALVGAVTGDFLFAARVEVAFAATFDAGALVVRRDETTWGKLAFERSPNAEAMVVSVVTKGTSDDCNSTLVDGGFTWLRIARIGHAFAFHASADGQSWNLVRHFRLEAADDLELGFEAQSPLGEGCAATFSEITFAARTLAELRDGS